LRQVLVPLALAQFICSFAGSNMNVMINDISTDLDTTVQGVQVAITIFLLVMAALMIPGGKLTDRYGRKRCFIAGLILYGIGALISAVSPSLGVLVVGNSILEGVGTALLIPPVYILTTLFFTNLTSRARAFGLISAAGGIGAAAGPLIGGLITSALSWRAAFVFQALVIVIIIVLSWRMVDPLPPDPKRSFDTLGAVFVRRRSNPDRAGHPRRRQQRLGDDHPPGRRRRGCSGCSSARSAPRSGRAGSRCCRRACSATGRPISA
jgi:MFS family permease